MQARHRDFALRLTEAQFHAAFVRLNGVDRLGCPQRDKTENNDDGDQLAGTAGTARTTGHHPAQAVLTTANKVFEIGRCVTATTSAGSLRALAPGTLVVSSAAATPWAAAAILIAPGHQNLFVSVQGRRMPPPNPFEPL